MFTTLWPLSASLALNEAVAAGVGRQHEREILMFREEWKGPTGAVVFMLTVFGIGWYLLDLRHSTRMDALDLKIERTEERIRDPLKEQIEAELGKTQKQLTAILGTLGPKKFGAWEERKHSVVYKAETDGFIAAATAGNSAAKGVSVRVGKVSDASKLSLLTRSLQYDGTVCPVPKGSYWVVERSTNSGRAIVSWLPIVPEQGDGLSGSD